MRQEPQKGQGRKKLPSTSVQYAGAPNWTEMIWNSVSVLSVMEIMNIARIICLPISIFINPNERILQISWDVVSCETNMPPDGGTTIYESQLLRTFGAPAAAAAFVIRAVALLTHTV